MASDIRRQGQGRQGRHINGAGWLLLTVLGVPTLACELGMPSDLLVEERDGGRARDAGRLPDAGATAADAGRARDAGHGPDTDPGTDPEGGGDAGSEVEPVEVLDAGPPINEANKSSGCGKTSTLTFGTVPGESGKNVGFGTGGYMTIQSSGRGFALRLPDNYDKNRPYWLIFGFHWMGGTSKDVDTGGSNGYSMAHFGLQSLSKNGAIFVAPQGNGNGWGSGAQDLKFVDDMVKLIEENYCVDTKNIFANGFSFGGGMSYAIACSRAKVFRGVAIYEGAEISGCEGGNDPIAYWQLAGLTDGTCTMGHARPMRDRFIKNNGCTAQNAPEPPMPPPYLKTGGHICTDYSGCSSGNPLRWCVHQSGHGNAIVDGTGDLYNSCATPPKTCSSSCPCTWVPEDVWKWMNGLK